MAFPRAPLAVLAAFSLAAGCASYHPDPSEPIEVDFDMAHIDEPAEDPPNQYYDFFDRTFTKQVHQAFDMPRNFRKIAGTPKQAENVDAFGQVPNSSWFTNRNGRTPMTADEIRRGPDTGSGPSKGIWTVVRGKTEGVTPGFTVKDESGTRFIIKFDPPTNPEMSTAAEMVSTKLFHAMGYNTPENRLVSFRAEQLRVDPEAKIVDALGHKRLMTQADLDDILERVARKEDGSFRVIASKFLDGIPKGPYSYHGTRKDDPNDIIPHEHRRELRGLRILGAWLEHNDIRRINSLDIYTKRGDRGFVEHYLIDFGATLGSASLFPNQPWEGHEYIFDVGQTLKSLFTLGVYKRRWHDAPEPLYPTVGLFESELFNPGNWKPNYPNPAFENMTTLDAYWATKIVMSFTEEQVRAAVETAEYSNPDAAEYLVKTLIERRDKIGRHWYSKVNALDRFEFEGTELRFQDLEVEAGFADASSTTYRHRLVHLGCGSATELGEPRISESTRLDLTSELPEAVRSYESLDSTEDCGRFFYVTIETSRDSERWGKWVRAYLFYNGPSGFRLMGVEHEG